MRRNGGEEVRVARALVLAGGPDSVDFAGVAATTGVSLTALESAYEEPAELLHAVWQNGPAAAVTGLLDAAHSAVLGDPDRYLSIEPRNADLRLAAVLLAVTPRVAALAESVPLALARHLTTLEPEFTDPAIRGRYFTLVTWVIGAALDPEPLVGGPAATLADLAPLSAWPDPGPVESIVVPPPLPLDFENHGVLEQSLLRTVTRVVARGGVRRVTLARLARAAGVEPRLVSGAFVDVDHLLATYAYDVFAKLFALERTRGTLSSPAMAAGRMAQWRIPELAERRRTLMELLVAAPASEVVRAGYGAALSSLAPLRSDSDGGRGARRQEGARHVTFGAAVLEDLGLLPSPDQVDWRGFTAGYLGDVVSPRPA